MAKHFLSLENYSAAETKKLLDDALDMKSAYARNERDMCLAGKTMVMLFEKPSSRTRISFQVAATELGGSSIYIRPEDIGGLGKREPVKDLARVLNGYVAVIVARTFAHQSVVELAEFATVPVINALTDAAHPCQAMADMITIHEHYGKLQGLTVAYIGDGNNVAVSLARACARLGLNFSFASPEKYTLAPDFIARLNQDYPQANINVTSDPYTAVVDADVIYTDTWTSMGQEEEKQQRIKDFVGFQVNMKLLQAARPEAIVMHCLPAYRGLEITDEVIESPQSVVFAQAENRLHFQRALVKYLLTS